MPPFKLLLAYGQLPSRMLLQNIFGVQAGFVVIGSPVDSASLQQMITEFHPDVIMAGISLPGMEGLRRCRRLGQAALRQSLHFVALLR
jgi:CheY-like chemotaxis protein